MPGLVLGLCENMKLVVVERERECRCHSLLKLIEWMNGVVYLRADISLKIENQ